MGATTTPRRVLATVAVALALGLPAGILRAACWGDICRRADPVADVPFCSLGPARDLIAAGWREKRSPQVLAIVTEESQVRGTTARGAAAAAWPSRVPDTRVPLVFTGPGVSGSVPDGATLDAVAPTIARAVGLDRPHPEVRSGEALPVRQARTPRLVVVVLLAGTGSADVESDPETWPYLSRLMQDGVGSLAASSGSLPLDPVAVAATVGTGGIPRQHGITGALIRNGAGRAVAPWSRTAPVAVVAALGDDLDEKLRQEPEIGLVAPGLSYRGLIGGDWYIDVDRDHIAITRHAVPAAREILERGYGDDPIPDLLGVVLEGERADAEIRRLVAAAGTAAPGRFLVVVAGTGEAGPPDAVAAAGIVRRVNAQVGREVVTEAVPGGFFVDPRALESAGLTTKDVVEAAAAVREDDGDVVFADVFPEIAVAFARYC